ncbi:MAG TPA: VIT family protein [Patescibacteria group bacterium]|nr:VIT family protein [Patescibacteria group bacterium]
MEAKKDVFHENYPEPHALNTTHKLNWLRASVLGANDGIVSISGLILGVAGATNSISIILTAGIAGIIAGAISMAAGEYVSVSSSRDTERALLRKERYELRYYPKKEFEELVMIYENKGLTRNTAEKVAKELTEHDAFAAHVDAELNIDPENLTNPWHAAFASAASFLVGALIPLTIIIIVPAATRIPITFLSVLIALFITGVLSAKASGANILHATTRVIIGGTIAMAVTYAIGKLFGVSGI